MLHFTQEREDLWYEAQQNRRLSELSADRHSAQHLAHHSAAAVRVDLVEQARGRALAEVARKRGEIARMRHLAQKASRLAKYRGEDAEQLAAVLVQRRWRAYMDELDAWAEAIYG